MARLCLFQETFTKWPSRLSRTWDSVRDLTSSPSRTIGTSACEDHLSQKDERRDPGSQTQKPDRAGCVRVRHGVRGRLLLLVHTFLVIFPKIKQLASSGPEARGYSLFVDPIGFLALPQHCLEAEDGAVNQFLVVGD